MDKLKDVDNETIKRFLEFIEKEKGKKHSEITIALFSLFLYRTKNYEQNNDILLFFVL